MKKILTSVLLAMTTLPVLANDVQTTAPAVAPAMPTPMMTMPKIPTAQMPNMQMPNMNGYGGNNGSNMKMPNMQMPNMQMPNMNGYGGNNGSNMKMPNMQMPNMQMPNMNGYGGNNGSNMKMPNMNWGNNGSNGSNWNMPKMNWGNNGNNGSNWNMPKMNWGNNNSGWNGAPMYMAVPMVPNGSMMRPVAPQMNAPQQAPVVRTQQKANTAKPVQKRSVEDIVKYQVQHMQRLNAAVAKQLAGATKEAPKAEAAVAK